jgi:hypothetical protein
MLKERAASALEHGLPVPASPPARARVPDVGSARAARTSSVPPSGRSASNRRMPLAVKLLGIGLLLLGVIYGLTLFRDRHTELDAVAVPAETDTARVAPGPTSTPVASPALSAK